MGPEKCRLFSLGWNLSRLQGGDSVWVRDGVRVCVPSQDKPNGPDADWDSFGGLERRACSSTSEARQCAAPTNCYDLVDCFMTFQSGRRCSKSKIIGHEY